MSEQPKPETSQEAPGSNIEQLLNEKRATIERIAIQLGFNETSELKELRMRIIESPGKISHEVLTQWRDQAESVVSVIEDKEIFRKAQIGLLITKALVYLDANMPDEFYEDVDDAIAYATNLELGEIIEILNAL